MPEFDWDEGNVEHIARHGVEPSEAEDVLLSPDRVVANRRRERGEHRVSFVGTTEHGRLLFVVVAQRGPRLRVVTAREPNATEIRLWRRRHR